MTKRDMTRREFALSAAAKYEKSANFILIACVTIKY